MQSLLKSEPLLFDACSVSHSPVVYVCCEQNMHNMEGAMARQQLHLGVIAVTWLAHQLLCSAQLEWQLKREVVLGLPWEQMHDAKLAASST